MGILQKQHPDKREIRNGENRISGKKAGKRLDTYVATLVHKLQILPVMRHTYESKKKKKNNANQPNTAKDLTAAALRWGRKRVASSIAVRLMDKAQVQPQRISFSSLRVS